MHKRRGLVGALAGLVAAGLVASGSAGLAGAAEPAAVEVPLKRVVLFTSGVGFFERRAEVQGNARVNLKFNVENINDLLKSMVVQDLGGGRISTVSYGSRDPITRTLQTFAIDLTGNPTLADILNQLRGEGIEVEAPNKITGSIVGVERRTQRIDEQVIEYSVLNLLTESGLRSVRLDSVGSIRLLDQRIDAEFRQALATLALGHANDKKTVSLEFLGEGPRPVRIGYIQEAPVWKTSYRLVLDDEQPPLLQGWAIVENTTESDWTDVQLTLVSGRPISFIMDLYTPLYVDRPEVQMELYASLRPQQYDQDLAEREQMFRKQAEGKGQGAKELARRAPAAPPGFAGRPADEKSDAAALADSFTTGGLQNSAQSLAQAGEVGELFQYAIETPVTLARRQSAMLPIVNESVEGEKVAIFNPAVHPKHPLSGLRLKNSTDLHLMQGPITVFDGGAYAGDARIADLTPGSQRLLSYALDLDTEVASAAKSTPEELVRVRIVRGTLEAVRKYQRSEEYTVKNSGRREKTVLIERPIDPAWTLKTPEKPAEKTRDLYRFAVTAAPGEPATLAVLEERIASQHYALTNLDDGTIAFFLGRTTVSDGIKAALQELVKRKAALAEVTQQKQLLQQQIAVIGQEQDRIRQNMAQLDRNTDLYNRYVKKFGEQEDAIEKHRTQIQALTAQETRLRKELEAFLLNLNLD